MASVVDRDYAAMSRERDLDEKNRSDDSYSDRRVEIENAARRLLMNQLLVISAVCKNHANSLGKQIGVNVYDLEHRPHDDAIALRGASEFLQDNLCADWVRDAVADGLRKEFGGDLDSDLVAAAAKWLAKTF